MAWKTIFSIIIWLQVWKLVAYAGVHGDPTWAYVAAACAFALTVWPFPVFKPKQTEDMDDKGV